MTTKPKSPAKTKEERLAEALRNNLRRRKQGAKPAPKAKGEPKT